MPALIFVDNKFSKLNQNPIDQIKKRLNIKNKSSFICWEINFKKKPY